MLSFSSTIGFSLFCLLIILLTVVREKRAHYLVKWRAKGGVLLIGYAAFRNMSLGRHVKDRNIATQIFQALHVSYQNFAFPFFSVVFSCLGLFIDV